MTEKTAVLVIEDDEGVRRQLRWGLDDYEVREAMDKASALSVMEETPCSVVTLDLGLPPDAEGVGEGFATLDAILQRWPETKVIVITGRDDHEHAVRAIGQGAYDFYHKPIDLDVLKLVVSRAQRLYQLEQENKRLLAARNQSPLHGIFTASPKMLEVCRTIEKVAPTDATVLLLGDSGTGKELLARALHELGNRNEGPFVAINCAAIPETLLESELFGYEKGAFTGATRQKPGKIELASGGTLFLDEIGDLPQALQAKLLRFLQERVIERLGGYKPIPVDVRVVCATHRDLERLRSEGRFREDLFYRISEITVRIPPLAERNGDVVLLARIFFERYREENKRRLKGFTAEALAAIESYHWPGNIRELESRVKRAVLLCDGDYITAEVMELPAGKTDTESLNLQEARDKAEREVLQRALAICGGNVSKAAELLGVSRPTCYTLMTKYGLRPRGITE